MYTDLKIISWKVYLFFHTNLLLQHISFNTTVITVSLHVWCWIMTYKTVNLQLQYTQKVHTFLKTLTLQMQESVDSDTEVSTRPVS